MGIANQMLSSCHFVQTGEKPLHWQLEFLFLSFSFFPSFLHPLEHNHRSVFVLYFSFLFCLEINPWPSRAVCFSSFPCKLCLSFSPSDLFVDGFVLFFLGGGYFLLTFCAGCVSTLNYYLQLSQNVFELNIYSHYNTYRRRISSQNDKTGIIIKPPTTPHPFSLYIDRFGSDRLSAFDYGRLFIPACQRNNSVLIFLFAPTILMDVFEEAR